LNFVLRFLNSEPVTYINDQQKKNKQKFQQVKPQQNQTAIKNDHHKTSRNAPCFQNLSSFFTASFSTQLTEQVEFGQRKAKAHTLEASCTRLSSRN
jgi:hypothetical protein